MERSHGRLTAELAVVRLRGPPVDVHHQPLLHIREGGIEHREGRRRKMMMIAGFLKKRHNRPAQSEHVTSDPTKMKVLILDGSRMPIA